MGEIKKRWTKWVSWIVFISLLFIIFKIISDFGYVWQCIQKFFEIIAPFLMGVLIAYLLYIPASKLEMAFSKSKVKFIKKRSRKLGVFTAYLITILVIIILINVILPVVIESVKEVVTNFQMYYQELLLRIDQLPEDSILKTEKAQEIIASIQQIDLSKYLPFINENEDVTDYAKSAISIVNYIIDIFVTVVVSVYFLLERGQILKFVKKLIGAMFDKKTCEKIGEYFNSTNKIFFNFLAAQFLDAVVIGIIVTIVLLIMNIKYAVLLGFLIGLFNMIPYFGAIMAVTISFLLTIMTGGLEKAIWMLIVVLIFQQIDANIINPKILGNSLKISPILVILAVTIGGAYFGVIGMFLAVPVVAVLKIVVYDYISYKNEERKRKEILDTKS
jgi:predicted PurR-regulated permease PerM